MVDFDPSKDAVNLAKHGISLARWVDLDQDGMPELVTERSGPDSNDLFPEQDPRRVYRNQMQRPDLLTTVDNGFGDRVQIISKMSTEVELPERADVIVSDLRGVLPLFLRHMPSIASEQSTRTAIEASRTGARLPAAAENWSSRPGSSTCSTRSPATRARS